MNLRLIAIVSTLVMGVVSASTDPSPRYLRRSTAADRELWPARCETDCAGLAAGTCMIRGCKGYASNNVALPEQALTAKPSTTSAPPGDRKLWLARCKTDCAGLAAGTCMITGCKGYASNNAALPEQALTDVVAEPSIATEPTAPDGN